MERKPEADPFLANPESTSFSTPLKVGLLVPIVVVVGAWCLQWLLRFPPRSQGASLTAVAVVLGLIAEIIPVPIAVTQLLKHPSLRSRKNVALAVVAALFSLPGLFLVVAIGAGH